MYRVTDTEMSDIEALLPVLRQADIDDMQDSCGRTADEILTQVFQASCDVRTVFFDEQPIAIFGIVIDENDTTVAAPWLVCSHTAENHPLVVGRQGRKLVNEYLGRGKYMLTLVDKRNALAVRWLQWLGFQYIKTRIIGPRSLEYGVYGLGSKEQCQYLH